MDMSDFHFGWLPEQRGIDTASFQIEPLLGAAQIEYVRNSLRARDGWFLPPLEPEWLSSNDLFQKTISYAQWFGLPATHRIVLKQDDDGELAGLIIGVLGVLKGLQLVLDGWGHFYRTPIKPGM